jgi:hypothetical protein
MNFRSLLASASRFHCVGYDNHKNHKDKNRNKNEEYVSYSVLFCLISASRFHIFSWISLKIIFEVVLHRMSKQYLCACVRRTLRYAGFGKVPYMKHLTWHTCRSLSTCPWGLLATLTVTATSNFNIILRQPRAQGRSALPYFAILFRDGNKCILFDGNLTNET